MNTPITTADLIPLLPIILATGVAVVVMILVAIRRNHTLTCAATITGLAITLLATLLILDRIPQQVTPLLLVDGYSLFFYVVVLIIAAFIAVFSYPYLYLLHDEVEEFYLLLTVATVGAMVLVSSNHFISAFLGIETLSIALYAMVAYPLHSKDAAKYPLEAGIKYLVLSAVATAVLLFGIALLYSQTGSLGFSDLVQEGQTGSPLVTVGLVLLIAGIAFKLSLVPFHLWTPDVYEGAPLPATTLLATTGKAAMFALLLRFTLASDALADASVLTAVSLVAVASMLGGNLLALLQTNLKRVLAYSSIAHMGYLLVALVACVSGSAAIGIESVMFYLLAYSVMSLGAFGIAMVVSSSEKEMDFITDYQGLFWREPWLALLFTAMLLSLAGIPLTVGFIGKFYLVMSGVSGSLWVLLATLVIGSGIGIFYYLRIVYQMLLPVTDATPFKEAGWASIGSYAVLAFLLASLFLLGVYPGPLMDILAAIAAGL